MLPSFLLLIAGFVVLIKGADWLVGGASSLAKRMGVSSLIVGLTVVAFGTSLPEMVVSVMAGARGSAEIALGNVLGSNMANVGLALGLAAVMAPLIVQSSTVYKEIPLAMASAILVLLLAFDLRFNEGIDNLLTARDGIVLLIFFIVFIVYAFSVAKSKKGSSHLESEMKEAVKVEPLSKNTIALQIIIGLIMVAVGGELVVRSSVDIARGFGLSEAFIGATIVALGTSLPEIVTVIIASKKKEADIAVGSIVGSNIFNALLVLGVVSIVSPIAIDPVLWADALFMIAMTFLLWIFAGRQHRVTRCEGVLLLAGYVGYIGFILERQGLV